MKINSTRKIYIKLLENIKFLSSFVKNFLCHSPNNKMATVREYLIDVVPGIGRTNINKKNSTKVTKITFDK